MRAPVCHCRTWAYGVLSVAFCHGASVAEAQHDSHRNAVREIARGQYAAATETLDAVQEDPAAVWPRLDRAFQRAGDTVARKGERYGYYVYPETYYVKALLESIQGDGEKALERARIALEAGLPFERFLAGPRAAFRALTEHPEFQQWRMTRDDRLLHGPMLGHVSDDAASFWVRTADESVVRIECRAGDGSGPLHAEEARTSADRDFTAVVRVDGLQPDTRYTYAVMIDDIQESLEDTAFLTYPPRGRAGSFRVAFGACAGYVPENERMWTTIEKQDPLALLLLGDNVYIDDPQHALTQRYCYYRRHARPEWRQLVAGRGVYAIWDDHDFGLDDSFGGPEVDDPPWKRMVWQIFEENWNNPAYGGGPDQPGVWSDFYIGDVHFIMLDGRYYREDAGRFGAETAEENPSMLGPVQLAWLKDALRYSKGTFKVLASPVPWANGTKGGRGALDTWEGYAGEREALFNFLADHKISGVILLSGDRHRTDARLIQRPDAYDLCDLMSAGLTNYHTHPLVEGGPGWLFGYNEKNSFALLHFDTAMEDPTMIFEIMSIDNESIWKLELKLSELTDAAQ